ncbi:hypothetical protein Tco_0206760 [Tanacetum coccineum]
MVGARHGSFGIGSDETVIGGGAMEVGKRARALRGVIMWERRMGAERQDGSGDDHSGILILDWMGGERWRYSLRWLMGVAMGDRVDCSGAGQGVGPVAWVEPLVLVTGREMRRGRVRQRSRKSERSRANVTARGVLEIELWQSSENCLISGVGKLNDS